MVEKREKENMQMRTKSWLKPKYMAKSIGHGQSPNIKKNTNKSIEQHKGNEVVEYNQGVMVASMW